MESTTGISTGQGTVMGADIEPVLDTAHIDALARDLNSRTAALGFIARFLRLLPTRVERIHHALAGNDQAQTMDAVLSLASSASMAGARQLERNCRLIQDQVTTGDLAQARRNSHTLTGHIQAITAELTDLLNPPAPTPDTAPTPGPS